MTYHLGIDLGTTYTAAATHEAGRIEVVPLGDRGPSIPSVLYMRPDGEIVAGDAANRHAVTDPERIAREFKRRLGDPTPVLLAGAPTPPEMLTGHLLRWVYDTVVRAKGVAPLKVALTHPANWGPYKRDLLMRAADAAGLAEVTLATEPQAAAISYATQARVDPGAVIAVYDLGGGTFDAAVLRKEADSSFTILGTPEGIERLGGIDFDSAVFAHVTQALEGVFDDLDPEDEATVSAVARLRQECTQAKEALSLDTEAVIPVLLPNTQTEVRCTRSELEAMIRPPLVETVTAMERAVRSAGLEPKDVRHVLLVGGSSRIPMVAQMVSSQLGRPVAVDAHPKHAIALGAAIVAARAAGVPVGDAAGAPAAPVAPAAAPPPPPAAVVPTPTAPLPPPPARVAPVAPIAPVAAPPPPVAPAPVPAAPVAPAATAAAPPPPAPTGGSYGAPPPPPGQAPNSGAYAAQPAPSPGGAYAAPTSGGYAPPPGPGHADPTFDNAHHEAPPPSLGYRQASAPPPPGASNDLPPGYLTREQKERVKTKQKWKGRAGVVVLFLILVVAVIATIALTQKGNEPDTLADVAEGECYLGEDLNDVDIVNCGAAHNGEVFKVIPAPDPDGAFPGDAVMTQQKDACSLELTAFFGAGPDVAVAAGLQLYPQTPSEAQWNDGVTDTFCVLGQTDISQTSTGTLKNAGAAAGG
ncbi:MAG TPA: Hsp70 family protein [Acidimicrobiales bacterium]|nr:Hsp70 family protein [Acidimicrobiales bacterium]